MQTKHIMLGVSLVAFLAYATTAFAAPIVLTNPLCPNPGTATCIDSFSALIARAIDVLMPLIGSIAVIIFIYAGILFLTSAGDPGQIQKAKDAVKYAIIGIVIALAGTGIIGVVRSVVGTQPGSVQLNGACSAPTDCAAPNVCRNNICAAP